VILVVLCVLSVVGALLACWVILRQTPAPRPYPKLDPKHATEVVGEKRGVCGVRGCRIVAEHSHVEALAKLLKDAKK
jgi:hypothetical protein